MPKDLTFTKVCDFIKNDDGELIEAVDNLLGVAIICSPIILGPVAFPALGLLGAKDGLTSLGKKLLSKITSKKESDYIARMQRMEIAYGLICYTAFFDAIDAVLPDDLRKDIALQPQDKLNFVKQGGGCALDSHKDLKKLSVEPGGQFIEPLPFPHPTSSFEEIKGDLSKLYNQMARNLSEFVGKLSVLEDADEAKRAEYISSMEKLPDTAIRYFDAQYFELARKYDEFRIWVQINNQKEMSNYLSKYQMLVTQANKQIDVGLDNLHKTVLAIPDTFRKVEAQKVIEGLSRRYSARIDEAVIEDKEISAADDKPSLTFPLISEAFIPQSYLVLRYMSKYVHLEKEETWQRLEPRHDLSAFILNFLSSPFSIEAPLLILGHPGSGKSLLTKVLSARLMSKAYTPIRIPLREVNAELGIEALVEKQIERDTECRINSWADFASQFADRPLLILLDGFDELLQASGTVFTGYLDKIQKFQQNQIVHEHPARVIVTSRITLIDKATVPEGSTVLRLLEFNEKQRNAWIDIWNEVNARYFNSIKPSVQPFSLPEEKEGIKKDKILELAEQPLLLLMLALYDSEDNSLREKTKLDRTVLYDSLLRRFVRRERRRYVKDFDHLPSSEQNKEIDNEMNRLGVAAIGMYNRRKLHVLSSELENDLEFFKLERTLDITEGRPLTQADLLLGSFFFVHQSSAGDCADDCSTTDTAFEFLHNTFGEFLTADFILRFAFQETKALHTLKQDDSLSTVLLQKLQDPNGLAKEWFACFMYAPLYLRPVIPEMIREWSTHLFQKMKFSRNHFLECFDEILKFQIKMLLESRMFPDIMRAERTAQFSDIPFIGLLATYTLNLMILRTILDKDKFIFKESDYSVVKDDSKTENRGTRPWEKLTQLWRSWFRVENLSGLSAIMTATRNKSKVTLKGRREFRAQPSGDQLNTIINVAVALGDDLTVGLAGLHARESDIQNPLSLNSLESRLNKENIDISLEFLTRKLRIYITQKGYPSDEGDELIISGFKQILRYPQPNNLVIAFFDLLEKTINRGCISIRCEHEAIREFMHPREMMHIMKRHPELIIEWLRLMKEFGGSRWVERYGEEFFERAMHPKEMMHMMERRPELTIEWLRLIREFRGSRWVERYGEEFFERAMHPKKMMHMMEMHPEVVIEWLRLALKIDNRHWVNNLSEFIREDVNLAHMASIFAKSQDAALAMIRVFHLCGYKNILQHSKGMYQKNSLLFSRIRRFDITNIPLDYIDDLLWYARIVDDHDLLHHINDTIAPAIKQLEISHNRMK